VSHASLLDELAQDGHLIRRTAHDAKGGGRWEVVCGAPREGHLHRDGNRYWAIDVSGMLPLYQELYGRVYAERLALWGAGTSAGLLRIGGLILFWGCDEIMRTRAPSRIARERLAAADERWVDEMDQRWRRAAAALDTQAEMFWNGLCNGTTTAEALRSTVDCKVTLGSIGRSDRPLL
jgi:hypothetical protein